MMRASRIFVFVAAVLVLDGCATPRPAEPESETQAAEVVDAVRAAEAPPARVTTPPPVDETALALNYFDRVRRLPSVELVRELDLARTTYGRTHGDADRVRLAMVLALPNTPVTDDARAIELLDPIVKNPAHALHHVAVLLSTYVQEQRRLAVSAQAMQKEVQTLQQKLDALRSLERALSEREGVIPRRR